MKKVILFATLALLGATFAQAAVTQADLEPAAIDAKVRSLPRDQRQAYAKEIIEAISAQPIDNDAKSAQLLTAIRALLGAARTTTVIAEVFNSTPVDLLPAIADSLARVNFRQSANGYNDEQWQAFCERVVSQTSEYIASSGTDAPALRQGILVGTFSTASNDPEKSRESMLAVLPAATAGAAAIYSTAMINGDTETLAEGAGADEVAATMADPNTDNVVSTGVTADESYLEPTTPTDTESATAGNEDDEAIVEVPLLTRYSDDVIGLALDTAMGTLYDWDNGLDQLRPTLPGLDQTIIVGIDEQISGAGGGTVTPSTGYAGQQIY